MLLFCHCVVMTLFYRGEQNWFVSFNQFALIAIMLWIEHTYVLRKNREVKERMAIPKETIAQILQLEAFENADTKMTEETLSMIQRYMELFIREAMCRSLDNKEKELGQTDIVIDEKDLERVVGLLLLDM